VATYTPKAKSITTRLIPSEPRWPHHLPSRRAAIFDLGLGMEAIDEELLILGAVILDTNLRKANKRFTAIQGA
jgi:hypothetical protein